jgi:hypothetical protein
MEHSRDFLYVKRAATVSAQWQQAEIERLHELLYHTESMSQVSGCHEVIDLNRFSVVRKQFLVEQLLRQPALKPFQFLSCKN